MVKKKKKKTFFFLKWRLCGFEVWWIHYKTMDKAIRLTVPEIGTTATLLYLPLLSAPFRNRKHNTSVSLLCFTLSGYSSPRFIRPLSLSLLFFIRFYLLPPLPSAPHPSFPYFERPDFQRVSVEPRNRWNDTRLEKTENKKRHFVAWPETEFPWRRLLGATQATVAQRRGAGIRLHLMGLHSDFFIRWWSIEFIVSDRQIKTRRWHRGLWLYVSFTILAAFKHIYILKLNHLQYGDLLFVPMWLQTDLVSCTVLKWTSY